MPSADKLHLLNSRLDEMRTHCLQETDEWLKIYQDGLNYTFNNQLAGKTLKDGWDPVTANYIFPAMMQELAIQSQRQVDILARPIEGGDNEFAAMWQAHLQWLYQEKLNMTEFLLRAALDGKIAGYYIAKTIWDPQPRNGWDIVNKRWVGQVRTSLILPTHFGCDPEAENLDDATYVFTARRVNKEWAKRRWTGLDEQIDRAATEDDTFTTRAQGYSGEIVIENKPDRKPQSHDQQRIIDLLTRRRNRYNNEGGKEGQYVTLEEFHFDDYKEQTGEEPGDRIPEEELIQKKLAFKDEEILRSSETGAMLGPLNWPTKEGLTYKEPVYPRGRMILRIGETILNPDTKQQIYPYSRQPFAVGVNSLLPHTWRGLNGVEMARGLQDMLNISMQHILNYVKYFGDPQVVVEDGALLGATTPKGIAKRLKSAAGKIIVACKGKVDHIKHLTPAGNPTGLTNIFQLIGQETRDQVGVHDVSLGRKSKGNETATELVRRDTNSKLRTAMTNLFLDGFTVKLWRNITELCQRNYEPDRVLRVIGKKHAGAIQEYNQGMKDVEFDIGIEIGTKLPFDQERKRQNIGEAIQLLGPAPTLVKRWLESAEFKNVEEILTELPQFQQFQQFMAQQQGADSA